MGMKTINSSYCGGLFGRRYDLYGAKVIAESDYSVTVRTDGGDVATATFDSVEDKDSFLWEYT